MSAGRVFVGLGANLGDARSTLTQALASIAALPGTRVLGRSSMYRTAPVDATGPDFVNCVAELDTRLSAEQLLRALQGIEQAHGRERPYRNAPRTLDLDILVYGDQLIDTAHLTVPHPRLHQRAFVLQPLAELAFDLVVPGRGPVGALAAGVTDQAIERLP